MLSWLRIVLFFVLASRALAQMAEQAAVDLERGLILHSNTEVNLGVGKDGVQGSAALDVMNGASREIADYTFACSIRFDHEPGGGGDHALEFAGVAMEGGGMRLILSVTPDGDIMAMTDVDKPERYVASPRKPAANRDVAIAVSIKRDARQALSGLWIDGVECESFRSPSAKEMLDKPAVLVGIGALSTGIVSNIRLYNRALSRPEIIVLAEQSPPKPQQEVIAIIGGTEAVALAESGWLDTYLNLSRVWKANDIQPLVRDLAWEGDTVFEQKRPLNFGSLAQQFGRVQARRVVIIVGRQECLDRGADGLSAFRDALTKLMQQCPGGAVIVGAVPFEKKAAPLPDLAAKNDLLARYDDAMRAVAEARGGTFVDTARSWRKQTEAWTRDGLTLNDHGARTLADIIAFHLGNTSADPSASDLAKLRELAMQKHALWHRYWRPSNWAFLYGDRTAQPSSRDHLNPNVRWFPQELEQYRSLIEAKENELWKLSQDLGRKLP